MRALRSQCFSPQMNNRYQCQLKKSKSRIHILPNYRQTDSKTAIVREDFIKRTLVPCRVFCFCLFFSRFMEAIPSYLAYSRKLFDHDMYELEAATAVVLACCLLHTCLLKLRLLKVDRFSSVCTLEFRL